jgi:hypothetical protein
MISITSCSRFVPDFGYTPIYPYMADLMEKFAFRNEEERAAAGNGAVIYDH